MSHCAFQLVLTNLNVCQLLFRLRGRIQDSIELETKSATQTLSCQQPNMKEKIKEDNVT
jgi:hypothetical protein